MATALEIYYKTQKPTSDVQEKAIDEFMGLPIKKKNIGLFHKLLDILDRPGNATRALLVGKLGGLKGMIPFAQTFENLTGLDVAMNKDELVTGSEVIEKWFGKQKQRKGKLDPVDVLGFMVEVAAEPLWLVGIGGLTKVGKAAQLAKSGIRAAKASGQLPKIKAMIQAAKAGKAIDATKLSKAFLTVYQSGGKPTLAKTWATQATKGQRALFKFAGKPVIKGERALGALEKAGAKLKAGRLGKVFLPPTRQVPVKYKELHDIYVHFGRDLPHVERTKYFNRLKELYQQGATKGLSAEDMDKVVRKYVQRAYAGEGGERLIKLKKGKGAAKIKHIVAKREAQAKALLAEQPELAGKIKGIGKEYKGLHEELIRGELAAGAPAKQITYPIGYASRRPTEAFREFLEANKHRPVVASFSRDLSARNPAQRMRNKVLGFMTDDEALDYFKKLGFKGKDVFEPGMAMPTMQRAIMSTRTVGAGRTVDEALKKFSKPDMPYWRGKGYTFSADEIMEKVGLRPEIAATMRGRIVPQDVADALLNMHSLATSEESLVGFWKTWVGVQRYMKGAFTMPWPAYHGRNMFSNFVLNWINGVQNPQSYLEALMIQMGRGKAIRLATGQVLSPDDILRHADDWGILGRSVGMFAPEEIGGQAIIGAKGVVKRHFLGQGRIRQAGQKLGVAVENNARLAHFIDKLKKGYNFNDAAVSAKKVLFDYGDLSRVEKRFLRDRGVFFYTFMRKNLPLQMETLLKQPGKQAVWSHLAGGAPAMAKKEPMPDWWREQIVTRPLFTTKKGEEMRIAGLGVPMEEAFGSFAGPGHSMWEGARRIAARQFGRLSPPITATTEFVTGKDIFYNKPISKLGYAPTWPTKHFPEPVKKALGVRPITYEGRPTRYTMSPQAAWALRKSPLARAWSSAAMLSREEEPFAIRASHFLTGFKPRMINPELQRQIGERRATKRYLEDQFRMGKVRRFERYYTPKEWPKDEQMEALLRSQ